MWVSLIKQRFLPDTNLFKTEENVKYLRLSITFAGFLKLSVVGLQLLWQRLLPWRWSWRVFKQKQLKSVSLGSCLFTLWPWPIVVLWIKHSVPVKHDCSFSSNFLYVLGWVLPSFGTKIWHVVKQVLAPFVNFIFLLSGSLCFPFPWSREEKKRDCERSCSFVGDQDNMTKCTCIPVTSKFRLVVCENWCLQYWPLNLFKNELAV